MKVGKAKAIGLAAVAFAMTSSTAAMAMYIPQPYCKNLEKNWTGSFRDWVNWVTMCS